MLKRFVFFITVSILVVSTALFSALFMSGNMNRDFSTSEDIKNSQSDIQGNACPPGTYPILIGKHENKSLWACSIYDERQRAEISRKINETINKLLDAGIYPNPVYSVSYELENSMFKVSLRRPPTASEYELLINSVPKPFIIYRNYGPIDYPCDNKNHPVKAWVGNGSNTEYSNLDVKRYLLAERILKEHYQNVTIAYPDIHPLTYNKLLVIFRDQQEITEDDIRFIRSLFPPQISIEIWTNVQDLIIATTTPSYVQILCGSTIVD